MSPLVLTTCIQSMHTYKIKNDPSVCMSDLPKLAIIMNLSSGSCLLAQYINLRTMADDAIRLPPFKAHTQPVEDFGKVCHRGSVSDF